MLQKKLQQIKDLCTSTEQLQHIYELQDLMFGNLTYRELAFKLGYPKLVMLEKMREYGMLDFENKPSEKSLADRLVLEQAYRKSYPSGRVVTRVRYLVTPKGVEYVQLLFQRTAKAARLQGYSAVAIFKAYGVSKKDYCINQVITYAYSLCEHKKYTIRAGVLNRVLLTKTGKEKLCKYLSVEHGYFQINKIRPVTIRSKELE